MKQLVFFLAILVLAIAIYTDLSRQESAGRAQQAAPAINYPAQERPAAQEPPAEPEPIGPRTWPPPSNQKLDMAQNMTASNYLIIFDGSGSMNDSQCSGSLRKIDAAKNAVKAFVNSLDPAANAALVAFGSTPTGRFYEHKFVSSGKEAINHALDRVESGGKTPLQEAMSRGYRLLEEQAQRQGGYGQYHMVIITDGISTDGDPGEAAINIANKSVVKIHAIGFCLEGGHSLDKPGYAKYSTANDPKALAAGLADALAESEQFDSGAFVSQQ